MDGTDEVGSSSWYTVTFVLKGRKVNGVRDVPAGQRHVTVCRSAEAIEGRRPETARDPSRDARAGPWPLALSLSVLTYGYLVRLSCLESRSSVDHITHGRCTTHDSPAQGELAHTYCTQQLRFTHCLRGVSRVGRATESTIVNHHTSSQITLKCTRVFLFSLAPHPRIAHDLRRAPSPCLNRCRCSVVPAGARGHRLGSSRQPKRQICGQPTLGTRWREAAKGVVPACSTCARSTSAG